MGRRRRRVDRAATGRSGTLPEAIAALSRSLPDGPSPEIFRRAKFDRPEAAPALWRLLFIVLSPRPAHDVSASLAPEAQARFVKATLRSQGYPRPVLAQLPEDGSQGSRELLLALSWLLARGSLIKRLLVQTHVQLGDQVPGFEGEALANSGPPASYMGAEVPVDLRHVQWLMGKLRFRWRHLISSQQEQCTLLSKIHLYTRGCHSDQKLGHLSVMETEMLRDPEGGQQLLWALERENARLKAALEWRRWELVFWKWMDSVLGTCPPEGPAAASQPTFLPRIPEQGTGELELVAQELQALHKELLEAATARRVAWEAQAGGLGRGLQWSSVRRASREAVEQELAVLQRSWEQDTGPTLPQGPCRLVRREDSAPRAYGLQAAEVIQVLSSQEASLEAALHHLQEQCRGELARLAGALPGLIWIPPLRR